MEFLKSLYNDELNSEGDIEIVGLPFQRSRILSELEPNAYEIGFEEWKNQRAELLLERAEQILAKYGNANRFEQLIKAYDNDNVMPFLGAGMSIPSSYPGWTEFLYSACEDSHVSESDLTLLLKKGKYEEAAQKLHDDMSAAGFNELLESEFKSQKEIIGAIHYLPRLFPKSSMITTNFDNLLERTFKLAKKDFEHIRSGKSLNEVMRLLPTSSKMLIKIHGSCEVVSDRVLLKSEYESAYGDGKEVRNFFNRVLFGRSLLFLGCSLNYDRTIKTMVNIVNEFDASTLPRHYAFLELKDNDDKVSRKKELAQANIFPIWYPEGEHDDSLEALFTKMQESM